MYTMHIDLKHQVSKAQYHDLLAEAERERAAAVALAARPPRERPGLAAVRTAIALRLLRVGSWLMPQAAPDVCMR